MFTLSTDNRTLTSAEQEVFILPAGEARKLVLSPRGGIFSTIFKGVVGVGRALLGVPVAAPVTARALAPVLTGAAVGAVTGAVTAAIPGAAPAVVGFPVGAAVLRQGVRKQTIVQTLNAQNLVIATQTLPGAPFLMNKDVVAAKRVFRLARKLHGKLPKRTVKESKVTQLKDAAVDSALRQIVAPCPPKPC